MTAHDIRRQVSRGLRERRIDIDDPRLAVRHHNRLRALLDDLRKASRLLFGPMARRDVATEHDETVACLPDGILPCDGELEPGIALYQGQLDHLPVTGALHRSLGQCLKHDCRCRLRQHVARLATEQVLAGRDEQAFVMAADSEESTRLVHLEQGIRNSGQGCIEFILALLQLLILAGQISRHVTRLLLGICGILQQQILDQATNGQQNQQDHRDVYAQPALEGIGKAVKDQDDSEGKYEQGPAHMGYRQGQDEGNPDRLRHRRIEGLCLQARRHGHHRNQRTQFQRQRVAPQVAQEKRHRHHEAKQDPIETEMEVAVAHQGMGIRVVMGNERADHHDPHHDGEEAQGREVVASLIDLARKQLHGFLG